MHTVLVIGGYGFFGGRIAAELSKNPRVRVLIGGRDLAKARAAAAARNLPRENAVAIDAVAVDLSAGLRGLGVNTVVHTAGPFQGQAYTVAEAACDAGCNYIDLADGRAFVSGVGALDRYAKDGGVTVISGASSVPALSAAVVDQYLPAFENLDAIRVGIGSGARAPGLAAVQGVFGYCGKPIRTLIGGRWEDAFGWLGLQRYEFPEPVGARFMGSCDVPDLELFPARYPGVKTVTFQAGFASDPGHLVVWSLARLVKASVLPSVAPFARVLNRMSRWLEPVVSDKGGMFVVMEGRGRDGAPLTKRWHLLASQNQGPYIPCGAAIALVNKIAGGEKVPAGATPCVGLLTVEEYLAPLAALDIRIEADPV